MEVIQTSNEKFKSFLSEFDSLPKIIPASSLIVLKYKKPILLVCVYHDSNILFIHGLFKSKKSTNKDFLHGVKHVGKFIDEVTREKLSIVTFTNTRVFKKVFEGFNFKKEEIAMLTRNI